MATRAGAGGEQAARARLVRQRVDGVRDGVHPRLRHRLRPRLLRHVGGRQPRPTPEREYAVESSYRLKPAAADASRWEDSGCRKLVGRRESGSGTFVSAWASAGPSASARVGADADAVERASPSSLSCPYFSPRSPRGRRGPRSPRSPRSMRAAAGSRRRRRRRLPLLRARPGRPSADAGPALGGCSTAYPGRCVVERAALARAHCFYLHSVVRRV